ncbi:ribonuclease D [Nocardioides jensenii]|uniref:ribonuclease D n=1 Tax=Nocardioides jensenii TaxID=1843 RepID=UPI0008296269|nr:ribonuclease D [Nocardioides jensenii]
MSDTAETPDEAADETAPEATPAPLLTLRDGLPPVIETEDALAEVVARFAAGTGPVAIDAERASGYRYSARAYLIQLRREGSGTALVDPIAFENLDDLQTALEGVEWILHAATQDLACLAEVGLRPSSLFDTELAGRLLGYPRVGLATLVETTLGMSLRKEHSAADWSRRPLPDSWLEYAALDVEPLVELRAVMAAELDESGKSEWARQEFEHLLDFTPAKRAEPWRRTSQLHRVRGRRALAAVRALWEARNAIAEERDVTPGRVLPDSAIIAAALAMPADRATLLRTQGFHGRGADRYAATWVSALAEAREMPETDLPQRGPRGDGPPVARAWAEKDPVAARRLSRARTEMTSLAETNHLPVENLLTPDTLRRVLWTPPATRDPEALAAGVREALAGLGARQWQIGLVEPILTESILLADVEPPEADDAPSSSSSSDV